MELTVSLLMSTRVGQLVRKMRCHQGRLGTLTTSLVQEWKRVVMDFEPTEELSKQYNIITDKPKYLSIVSLETMDCISTEELDIIVQTSKFGTQTLNDVIAIFNCSSCEFKSKYSSNIDRHIERMHNKLKRKEPDFTNDCTPHKKAISDQDSIYLTPPPPTPPTPEISDPRKPFSCNPCGTSYASKDGLTRHRQKKHQVVMF
jgi:hypothetical protein